MAWLGKKNMNITLKSEIKVSFVEPTDSDAEIAICISTGSESAIVLLTRLCRDMIASHGARSESAMLLRQELARCVELLDLHRGKANTEFDKEEAD